MMGLVYWLVYLWHSLADGAPKCLLALPGKTETRNALGGGFFLCDRCVFGDFILFGQAHNEWKNPSLLPI